MICPYCNQELEKGTLRSRYGALYLPDDTSPPIVRLKKSIKKRKAIPLPPDLLSDWPVAYACRICKKIIVPYDDSF